MEEYKQQLTDARAEANRIREEARAEGAQILADLKEKAAAESARITEQAHDRHCRRAPGRRRLLRAEVGTLATTLAGRIVGEALNDDERSARVVDRFLADLENQDAANQSVGAARVMAGVSGESLTTALADLEAQLPTASLSVGTGTLRRPRDPGQLGRFAPGADRSVPRFGG